MKRETHGKVCSVCGSLPHRVAGLRCGACGLRRGSEAKLHAVDFGGIRSEPTYPAGAPRLGREEIATATRHLSDLTHHDYVRRPRMIGEQGSDESDTVNPFFKDELGKRYGTLIVISRAQNLAAQARWRLRCDVCGGLQTLSGHSIRRAVKLGQGPICHHCVKIARTGG